MEFRMLIESIATPGVIIVLLVLKLWIGF